MFIVGVLTGGHVSTSFCSAIKATFYTHFSKNKQYTYTHEYGYGYGYGYGYTRKQNHAHE